jgi:pimeloyl-ACP methyl ester carboxylesterase
MLRRFVLPALVLTLAAVPLLAAHADPASGSGASGSGASGSEGPLGLTCAEQTSSDGVHYRMCSGEVPSFDGTGLDVDLTLPGSGPAPYPTVLLTHGWSNDKHEWESTSKDGDGGDKYHWNNVWFASENVATVTYTARGFGESCGITDTDANCVKTGVHLADRRWETKDSQTLLGDLVDAGVADAARLGASGGSYGGGQSWLLATSLPWQSANGTMLQLSMAVPKYPWTDLAYSLAPNGRENDDKVQGDGTDHTTPYGIEKASYDAGLYATGRTSGHGRYNPPDGVPDDPASQLDALFARTNAGEPYDGDPVTKTFVDDFRNKSAYYAQAYFDGVHQWYVDTTAGIDPTSDPKAVKPVPVLSIQGWTDPLFPAVETLQMYRKLKQYDPDYPISIAFGDIGHSNAQNPDAQWQYLNSQADNFLGKTLQSQGNDTFTANVDALVTHCPATDTVQHYSGTSWDGIRNGVVHATAPTSRQTTNPAADTTGTATDPITNSGCLHSTASSNDAASSWSWPIATNEGFTQLGLPRLTVDFSMVGTDATLGLRLWDVAPDGTKTLADRGVYRLTATANGTSGRLSFELYGNCWEWQAGHTMQLQVTQTDTPYLRPDNLPSTVTLSNPRLDIPTHEAGEETLAGS